MKKQSAFLLICSLLFSLQLWAQERTIRGTVLSADDQSPLPGVTVRASENSSLGAITDIDGKYQLKVGPEITSLVFTYVGYDKKVVQLGASNVYDVALESSSLDLNEVVVTANAIEREKKELGYVYV